MESEYLWAEERRADFELINAELLEAIADHEVRRHRFEFALPHLQSWANMFPFTERVHVKIIALYLLMNNREAAMEHHRKSGKISEKETGTPPEIDLSTIALDPYAVFST